MQQACKTQAITAVNSLKPSLQFILGLRMFLVSLIRTDTFPEISSCDKRSIFPRKLLGLGGSGRTQRKRPVSITTQTILSLKILFMFRGDTQKVTCHCFFCKYCFIAHASAALPSLLFPTAVTTALMTQELCEVSNEPNKQDNWKTFLCICSVLWLMQFGMSRDQITD